jgi:RNA polymerase sigma factor (sigma-70 family)
MNRTFEDDFDGLFRAEFPRLFRYLDRLSGDAEVARDLAQDTFVRLLRRGRRPDRPEAWLITVATNLWRNTRTTRSRRARLLGPVRGPELVADPSAAPCLEVETEEDRARVRAALGVLPARDQELLLLMAEGYSYRDIADVTGIHQASVGTLLARAKRAFREAYQGPADAS